MGKFVVVIALMLPGCLCEESFAQTSDAGSNRDKIRERMMSRFDQDGDGRLSSSERGQMRERLKKLGRKAGEPVAPTVDPANTDLYKLATGPWRVEHQDLNIPRDDETEIAVRVTYPTKLTSATATRGSTGDSITGDEGNRTDRFPVIVFSHGAGGSHKTYSALTEYWSSYGYVCLQPRHGDSIGLLAENERRGIKSLEAYVQSAKIGRHVFTRTDDVKLVLDQFRLIESRIPGLQDKLDSSRIGMGGHSYGAMTTQMIGGMSVAGGGQRETREDERPKALLMISPQGTGGMIDDRSWEHFSRPAMVITGSRDEGRRGESYQWRLEAYENLASDLKYLTFIEDATHDFGGISGAWYPGIGPSNPDHVLFVKSASLAFWDAQLKEDAEAVDFLSSEKLQKTTDDAARITLRKK